jgi:putative transcriptional regulator
MENGILYATNEKTSASAEVLKDALKGEDVALTRLNGTIELKNGTVTIIKLPTVIQGGSRASDIPKIQKIHQKGFDRVGIMGTISRAVTQKMGISPDFEFATPYATVAAAKKGLNVLVLAVGNMTKSITRELDEEGIQYTVEDFKK